MSYKLLALDLDGTLLMPDKTLPEDVKNSVADLLNKGIIVTLCTGRMFPTVEKYATELGINYPLICYNGALIKKAGDTEPIMYEPLDPGLQEKIIDCGEEHGWYLQLYQNDRVASAEITFETLADPDSKTLEPIALGKLSEAKPEPSPKMMSFCNPEEVPLRIEVFREATEDKLYIASSTPNLVEMMKKGVCKSEALKKLCEIYGIASEEVIVCGDSGNDADMIVWAGFGCAMQNATEELKNTADYVCINSYSYGVKEVIEKFF